MIKFTGIKNFADREGKSPDRIRKRMQGGKLPSLLVYPNSERLVIERDNLGSIILFCILKGGSGKSTLSTHIATWLTRVKVSNSEPLKVCLVDLDPQCHARNFFQDIEPQKTIYQYIENHNLGDTIQRAKTLKNTVDFINGDKRLVKYNLTSDKRDKTIKKMLEELRSYYDITIIDTPPDLNLSVIQALEQADTLIAPAEASSLHADAIDYLTDIIAEWSDLKKLKGIIVNRFNKDIEEDREFLSIYKEKYPELLFDSIIPQSTYLRKSSALNTNIFDLRGNSKPAVAIRHITKEILERL